MVHIGALILVLVCLWSGEGVDRNHQNIKNPQEESIGVGTMSPRDSGLSNTEEEDTPDSDLESFHTGATDDKKSSGPPPEDSQVKLKKLLGRLDGNKDGNIERTEIFDWILQSLDFLSQGEDEVQMDEVDSDGDGYVTWEEYISESQDVPEYDDEDLLDEDDYDEQKLLEESKQLFTAADKNSDGRLDEKEFLAFTHPEDHPDMLSVILQQILAEKDRNKDGVIDFEEYIGSKVRKKSEEWLLKEKEMFDVKYDSDGNGVLDSDETWAWMLASYNDIAEDGVEDLSESDGDDDDGDGDDIKSFLEVIEHYNMSLGSETKGDDEHLHEGDRFQDEL